MKAEQRKKLERNELADRLSRWWQGSDGGKSSSVLWLSVGVAVLVLILIVAWRYYREAAAKNRAAAWKQLELAASATDLEAIMEAHRGTAVGRMAKTQLARLLLNEGLNQLGSDLQRSKAIENVERARDLYRELAEDARDDDLIRREALLAAGKAEESLVGVSGSAGATRGSLDTALEWYEKAASQFPDSPEGRAAAERAKAIRENRDKIKLFYEELAKRYRLADEPPAKPASPSATPTGTGKSDPGLPLAPPQPTEPAPKDAKPADAGVKDSPMPPLAPPPGATGSDPAKSTEPSPPAEKPNDETKQPTTSPSNDSGKSAPKSDSTPPSPPAKPDSGSEPSGKPKSDIP